MSANESGLDQREREREREREGESDIDATHLGLMRCSDCCPGCEGNIRAGHRYSAEDDSLIVMFMTGVAMSAAHITGNHMWDACGSLAVSCLLGATAVFLIQQNRSLLLGTPLFIFIVGSFPHPAELLPSPQYIRLCFAEHAVFLIRRIAPFSSVGPGLCF
jgi:hypothetical protein